MLMTIEVIKAPVARMEGKYQKMDFMFLRDGKPQSRKLVAVGKTKDIFPILTNSKDGDVLDIEMEKDGDYWNWIKATPGVKAQVQAAAEGRPQQVGRTGNTYETPEERARKQVYITRHGSVNTATEFLVAQGKKFTIGEVFDIADLISSYVFSTNGAQTIDEAGLENAAVEAAGGDELKDDIPF